MGKRGPTPSGKLRIIDGTTKKNVPTPPRGMSPHARILFKKIVGDNGPDAFDTESISLVRAFCEADNQHTKATMELELKDAVVEVSTKAGVVPRRNPWFDVQKESAAVMNSISTKLRKRGVTTNSGAQTPKSGRGSLMFMG
jgi:hypothetical protein